MGSTSQPGTTYGTWEGWGASLCWWANVYGTRDDLADIVFTTNYTTLSGRSLPGLGMNIARYNAGACSSNNIDGQTMQVSPNIPWYKQISSYWLDWLSSDPTSGSWNWNADAKQRTMLLKAKARGANLLELFSNSPVWWMCYNHNPSGAESGANDNLQSWNYTAHAVYLATVAKYAQTNWGITFDSVEPFNEPSGNWWTATGTQEGCHFSTDAQAAVIGSLRTELDNRGLSAVKVAASDENTYDSAISTWNSFSSSNKAQVGRVNVHGYQGGGGRRDLLYSAVGGKRLWNSEYGEGDSTGKSLASNFNLDFQWLHPTAWCYWQPLDWSGWGLIQCNLGDNWIGPPNPKYYVLAQYSRHIRPGMTILRSSDGNSVAAYDRGGRKLVIVTANYDTAQTIAYALTNFPYAGGPIRRWATLMGDTGDKYRLFTDTVLSNKSFACSFATNTIQTFEIQNVDSSVPLAPTGLVAVAGAGLVSLNWSAALGATNYMVKRATNSSGPYAIIAQPGSPSYTDTTVTSERTYYYVVSALNGAGESGLAGPVSVSPEPPPKLAMRLTRTQIWLSWPDSGTNYQVQLSTNLSPTIRWSVWVSPPQRSNGTLTVVLPMLNGPQRYFRLSAR